MRGAYRRLLDDPDFYQELHGTLQHQFGGSLEKAQAGLNYLIELLRRYIDPAYAPVEQIEVQDRTEQHRLTRAQLRQLILAPDRRELIGWRDTLILAFLAGTGLRRFELTALQVPDVFEYHESGDPGVLVREGKGGKQRVVPYGEMDWLLALANEWLDYAGIDEGPVFRGFYRGGNVRPDAISERAVENVVKSYPVPSGGGLITVRPHDLRRTYARLNYEAGMDPVAIQQNLGHSDLKTTMDYIGVLDTSRRRSRGIIDVSLGERVKLHW